MWRILHAFAIAALIGSAAYVYGVKYRTIYASEQLVKTRHLINKEKDAINLLRAEYAHLARPDRVQSLADSKLGLQPLALSQIATVNELPDAQPKTDSIGRQLESLGFTADNSTPAVTAWVSTPPVRRAMAETPTDSTRKATARARLRFNPLNMLADAAIAGLRRYLPKNFGVDLEGPGARLPQPAGARKAKLKAFARQLLSTRLDRSSARVRTRALGLFVAYAGIAVKLLVLGLSHDQPQTLKTAADDAVSGARPDLLDRNGAILATDVKTMSVFAEPNRIIDIDEAVELITAVLPDVDAKQLRERLASKKGFIWVKRQITA